MKVSFAPVLVILFAFAGCRSNFFTEEDFPSVLKIDAHVHINSDKGFFEEQAGKDNFSMLTINVDVSDSLSVKRQYDFAVESVRKHRGRVFYSPTFFFDTTGWGTEVWSARTISKLNSYITNGAVSVKLWKNIGMTLRDKNGKFIMVDDPRLEPVIDFIVMKGLAVTGHLGEPRNCWLPLGKMTVKSDSDYFATNPQYHMYLHPDYPSYDDQINARDHLLEKHPDLIFIGCHLGSLEWSVDELAKRLDRFPNMAVDLAARICHLQYQSLTDYEKVRNFCIRYQERLIYGTDLEDDGTNNGEELARKIHKTWIDDWEYFTTNKEMISDQFKGKFTGLHLPKEVVRKIFNENAIRWYKLNKVMPGHDPTARKTTISETTGPAFHKWAATPPMGWNSWDCYGPTVVEDEVKANADYMAAHLKKFGWKYIVVDIRWYVANDKSGGYNEKDPVYNMDNYGRLLPAVNRFPSAANGNGFKPLGEYIHNKGLKFGIHMMRGIPVIAVKGNTPILGSSAMAQDIYTAENQCFWLKDMYTIVAGRPGSQEYYNSVFQLYASWGLDFVKVDDLSGRTAEIEMVRKAIDNCGRPIVISISPGGDRPEAVEFLKNNVNMWRTSNDFWDNWHQLKNQFRILNNWVGLGVSGCYPDGDMLPLGKIGLRAERGEPRWSGFTKDEQYTLMTLFSIFRSPLMFGGDLPSNDEFTLSLITNKNVLEVNQHSSNGRQLFRENDLIVWTADDPTTGDKYLAFFNARDQDPVFGSKAIWKSEEITRETPGQSIDIDLDLTGAKKLYLVVTYDDAVGFARHNCDWIEPKLTAPKGSVNLTDLKWVNASAGQGEPVINQTVQGEKLAINGKVYKNGINVNATSIIEYNLPEGVTRFKAKAGLQNGLATGDLPGQDPESQLRMNNTGKFLVFVEDPAGPEPDDTAPITVKFAQIGLKGTHTVKDLWTGENLGNFTDSFTHIINRHGAGLYRIH